MASNKKPVTAATVTGSGQHHYYGADSTSGSHTRGVSTGDLVSRLEGVKQTGPGRWIACCPAHEDRSPSLSIRELEDGRTLLHCFGGCYVDAVVGAVGLTVSDLFPPRRLDYVHQPRRGVHPMDALTCLQHEATLVLIVGRCILNHEEITSEDLGRVAVSVRRFTSALEVSRV